MITQQEVKKRFYYDNGNLYYKNFSGHMQAGSRAGQNIEPLETDKNGKKRNFVYISIDKKQYRLDRLIYLYHFGILPIDVIHKNEDLLDCRIGNLKASDKIVYSNIYELNKQIKLGIIKRPNRNGWVKKTAKNYYFHKPSKTYRVIIQGKLIGHYKDEKKAQLVVKDLKDKLYKHL